MSDEADGFWEWATRHADRLQDEAEAGRRLIVDEARRVADDVLALSAAFWDAIDALPFVPERRSFPPVRTQYYGHGAFMGAAPALLADPLWRRILGFLMPDVFDAVRAHIGDESDPGGLMTMMENNPVLAAFGTTRAAADSTDDEHPNHLVGLEWDLFVDEHLIEAFAAASSADERAAVLDRVVDTSLIAHAGALDTVQESLGFSQYADVRATPKTEFGGVEMDSWIDLFGRALALAHAPEFDRAVAAMSRAPRSASDEPCMLNTFATPWAVDRVVEMYRRVTGRPRLSIIIDIKSRASTPAFLSGLVGHLNRFGVHVAAIGSFSLDELRGVRAVEQRVGGEVLSGPKEVLFFHYAGDLQAAARAGEVPAGQTVMFNGASLLEIKTRVPGGTDHDFTVHPLLLEQLEALRASLDLEIGIYVQEGDCEAAAASALSAVVDAHPRTFELGFAWGGLRSEVGLPSATLARAGYGGQLLLAVIGEARHWDLDGA